MTLCKFTSKKATLIENIQYALHSSSISGSAAMALAVDRTPDHIYKWRNPNNKNWPSLAQLEMLQAACLKVGAHDPIAAYFKTLADNKAQSGPAKSVAETMLSLDVALGQAKEAILKAKAPCGPGGNRITKNEAAMIDRGLQKAQRDLADARASLRIESEALRVIV